MAEQLPLPQVIKLASVLVEHLRYFERLSPEDRQWAIQNPGSAMDLFVKAVTNRESSLLVRTGDGLRVSGSTRFVVAEKYREGKVTDGVKIRNLGPNFKDIALPLSDTHVKSAKLFVDALTRDEWDVVVMSTSHEQGTFGELANTFSQFFEYLKTADHNHPSFSYIRLRDGIWTIVASWIPMSGFDIELLQFPNPDMWKQGDLLVTRKIFIC